ncbi:hypothetical protein [Streptomyces sp. NWU339]|uniref:hypothetical protein n=1 Tax=Streptomyces sp. NWU339 TaxID=2185284 RepID=UPI0015E81F09|nr:hypothetical protein [Streptomyces sp. NWU339]
MTTEPVRLPYPLPSADPPDDVPSESRVEARIISMDPEAARHVADALRLLFAGGEQRSYPACPSEEGHVCTSRSIPRGASARGCSWLEASRPPVDRTHPGETA